MQKIIENIKKLGNPVLYETGGNNEFISPNIFKLTGYYAEEIIVNRDLFPGLINPEDYIETNFRIKNWHKEGEPGILSMCFRFKESNGQMIWIEDHLSGRKTENAKYMQGLMVDITREKNKEADLLKVKGEIQEDNSIPDNERKNKIAAIEKQLAELNQQKESRFTIIASVLNSLIEKKLDFHDLNLDFLTGK